MTSEEPEANGAETKSCSVCGTSISVRARFCETCGARVVPAEATAKKPAAPASEPRPEAKKVGDEFEDRESAKLAKELFKEHMQLIEGTAASIAALDVEVTALETTVRTVGAQKFSDARTRAVQDAIESVERIGDAWEEVQHKYNRESESLDEAFVDRAAEMEIDFELPPERREKLEAAMAKLSESMASLEARIEKVAGLADRFLRQPGGRWFGAATANTSLSPAMFFFALATAGSYFILRGSNLAPSGLAAALVLPWIAFVLSIFAARR